MCGLFCERNGGDGLIILKILLWILRIILIVLLVLAAAFAIPVGVSFKYGEKPELAVKYLFLRIPIDLEQSEEKERKKKEKEEKKERKRQRRLAKKARAKAKKTDVHSQIGKRVNTQDNSEDKEIKTKKAKKEKKKKKEKKENKTLKKLKALWKKRGLEGIVELIKEIAAIAGGLLGCVFKHIFIQKLDLYITVAFEDASDTAVKYGYACAGVYPAMAVILRVFRYKDYNISITPDFDKKQTEITVDTELRIVPWFVMVGAAQALFRFLKLKAKGML